MSIGNKITIFANGFVIAEILGSLLYRAGIPPTDNSLNTANPWILLAIFVAVCFSTYTSFTEE